MLILSNNVLLSLWNQIFGVFINDTDPEPCALLVDQLLLLIFGVDGRHVVCLYSSVVECIPVHAFEERVGLHLVEVLLAPESTGGVAIQQFSDYVLKILTHEYLMLHRVWEHNSSGSNENAQLVMTFIHEGWSACGHLIQQNSKRPPVNGKAVAFHIEYLRGQILCGSAERESLVSLVLKELCKAKIGQTHIAILVHEDVFWLQVPVNYVLLVQIPQSKHNLSSDELDSLLLEPLFFVDIIVDVASWQILQEKVNSELILEHEVH